MTRIRVDPDDLRELAHRFSQTACAFRSLHGRLSTAWGRLNAGNWERAHRGLVEPQWWQARSRLNGLADQAETFSHFLVERAARFEEADHAGVAAVGQAAAAFAEVQQEWNRWFRPLQPVLNFPQALIGRTLRLGGRGIQIPIASVAALNGLEDGYLMGTRDLRPISPQWQQRLEAAIETQTARKE